jgi:BrnA antitoxin of type II toxin-antitoxin system
LAKATPFAKALPELAGSIRRGRGPNKAPTKKLVSLRLSGAAIEKYKAEGPGWRRIDQDCDGSTGSSEPTVTSPEAGLRPSAAVVASQRVARMRAQPRRTALRSLTSLINERLAMIVGELLL